MYLNFGVFNMEKQKNDLAKVFSKNFNRYLAQSQKTRQDICDILNVPYSTISSWSQGKRYPRIDKIEALAKIFGIDKADLIEENKKNCKQSIAKSPKIEKDEVWEMREKLQQRPELKVLFDMSSRATKEDVEKAIQMMEIFIGKK